MERDVGHDQNLRHSKKIGKYSQISGDTVTNWVALKDTVGIIREGRV